MWHNILEAIKNIFTGVCFLFIIIIVFGGIMSIAGAFPIIILITVCWLVGYAFRTEDDF